ncbi:DUF1766 family protein [Schizosaccharomyces japonicus yFS275]|uniref:DUF1766 family protein n=1 Tax=Schizosaccharomyces japonicus (strain yFS275 / FY16936) TaxID=402676 RepID=B6K0F7_SCHJY|nr:DUF1766 family protein [Schizosaccharomyces japonicus yFS275]EEB06307.1 DUF1766 family protein [Schizosaccharomyces japonicus yFS275]
MSSKKDNLHPLEQPGGSTIGTQYSSTPLPPLHLDRWSSWKRDAYSIYWSLSRKVERFCARMCGSSRMDERDDAVAGVHSFEDLSSIGASNATKRGSLQKTENNMAVVHDEQSGNAIVVDMTKPVEPALLKENMPGVRRKHLPPRLSFVASSKQLPNDGVIVLEDWINPMLSQATQIQVQRELCQHDSYDCDGYICVFLYEKRTKDPLSEHSQLSKSIIEVARVSDLKKHFRMHSPMCSYSKRVFEVFPDYEKCKEVCRSSFKIARLIELEVQDAYHYIPPAFCEACNMSHEHWLEIDNGQWEHIRGIILRWIEYSRVMFS